MGQLEGFRASLKRKDSAESSEGEIPSRSFLLFISFLNGGTGGDFMQ